MQSNSQLFMNRSSSQNIDRKYAFQQIIIVLIIVQCADCLPYIIVYHK